MNRKTKEQSASEELKAHRAYREKNFSDQFTYACSLPDPAVKVLVLERMRQAVAADIRKEERKIFLAASEAYPFAGKEVMIGAALLIPTLGIGTNKYIKRSIAREAAFRDRLTEEAADHLASLPEKEMLLDVMIDALLEDQAKETNRTDFSFKIMDELRLMQKFVEAILKQDRAVAREAPADAEAIAIAQQTAQPRQTRDYSKLNFRRSPGRTI